MLLNAHSSVIKKKKFKAKWLFTASAAVALLFLFTLNTSTTFAKNMAQIPALSSIVEILTFATIEDQNGNHQASIQIPKITGDSEEIATLNAEYAKEGRELYEQYLVCSADMEKEAHYGIESGYIVLTDNDQLLSFVRYIVEVVGTSSTIMKYTTIDKNEQIVITLPSLFKDDSYVTTISAYIANEMRRQKEASNGEIKYWLKTEDSEEEFDIFETIEKNQNFYITNEGKLVITFHKYEVAPGFMGAVEFEIPTNIIKDKLVSNTYIK